MAGKPTLQPLAVVDASTWNALRAVLTKRYPDWEFLPDFASPARAQEVPVGIDHAWRASR